jgi:hypothetical protein
LAPASFLDEAAEQEIAADNHPSSLRSGGRLQLNFSRSADEDGYVQRRLIGLIKRAPG